MPQRECGTCMMCCKVHCRVGSREPQAAETAEAHCHLRDEQLYYALSLRALYMPVCERSCVGAVRCG